MQNLTTGRAGVTVLGLTAPLYLGNLVQQLYIVIDGAVVGLALGANALAAVGAAYPVLVLLASACAGLSIGFTIKVAQLKGQGDVSALKQTLWSLLLLVFAYGGMATVCSRIFAAPMLLLLGVPPELHTDAEAFMRAFGAGLIPILALYALSAALRGLGDTKTPFVLQVISSALNIALALLFVLTLKWGVAGAAYATVAAQTVALLIGAFYCARKYSIRWSEVLHASTTWLVTSRALKLGLPLAVQAMLIHVGVVAMVAIVSQLGSTYLAAYTILARIELFATMPFLDLSSGLMAFTGQNVGARRMDRVRRGLEETLIAAAVIAVALGGALLAIPVTVASAFVSEPSVIKAVVPAILLIYPWLFAYALMAVSHGSVNGLGRTMVPLICTVIATWIVRIPLAAWGATNHGFAGVVHAFYAAWIGGCIYSLSAAYWLIWKPAKLTYPEAPT